MHVAGTLLPAGALQRSARERKYAHTFHMEESESLCAAEFHSRIAFNRTHRTADRMEYSALYRVAQSFSLQARARAEATAPRTSSRGNLWSVDHHLSRVHPLHTAGCR